jgi:hypothetical protein
LDCGGKSDATPLFARLRQSNVKGYAKAPSPLPLSRRSPKRVQSISWGGKTRRDFGLRRQAQRDAAFRMTVKSNDALRLP